MTFVTKGEFESNFLGTPAFFFLYLEELKESIIKKKINPIFHWQDTWGKKIHHLSQKWFILVVLSRWKIFFFFNFERNFTRKKRYIYLEVLISYSFDEPHCTPVVHTHLMKPIFQDIPLYCNKMVTENPIKCCHFRHGGGTHFMVFARFSI